MIELPNPQYISFREEMKSEISSTTYSVHGIDKYPAKLIPQASNYILRKYIPSGSSVLDPFCGTGSVLVEASLNGCQGAGIDLNPLATLFASVKTTKYTENELNQALSTSKKIMAAVKLGEPYSFPNASIWFTPIVLSDLARMQKAISIASETLSISQSRFLNACLARIVRDCSKADSRGPKPFISKRARSLNRGIGVDVLSTYYNMANFMKKRLLEYSARFSSATIPFTNIQTGDARCLNGFKTLSPLNAVITSPPYINAQDYYRSSKLELRITRLMPESDLVNFSRSLIGSDRGTFHNELSECDTALVEILTILDRLDEVSKRHANIARKYFINMKLVFQQMKKVLLPDSKVCIVIGHNRICGIDIPTPTLIAYLASTEGFKIDEILIDLIQSRHLPPERNGHNSVIKHETVLIMSA